MSVQMKIAQKKTMSRNPLLAGLLTVFVMLTVIVSFINPLFEAPDEIRHYRYIRKLVLDHQLPIQGQEEVRSQSHHPPLYYFLAALVSAWTPSAHTSTYEHPINPFWGYRNWDVGVDNKVQYWHTPSERFPFREGYLAVLVPRWVNGALGVITVALTYQIGRLSWPEEPILAWSSAAAVAFNPQFIYLSAAINNDILAAACGAAILLFCIRAVRFGIDKKNVIGLGATFGCALLSKLHLAVAMVLIAAALLWAAWNTKRELPGHLKWLRRWVNALVLVGGIAVLLSGWWFIRNWMLYGDLTGMRVLNELWGGRSARDSWWAIWQGLPYLWSSLWGRFGYGQIPLPGPVYSAILAVCVFGLIGYALPRQQRLPASVVFLLFLTITLYSGVVLYYMLIQPAGAMGRFLFPALPAFTVLVVGGLNSWLRVPALTATSVGILVFSLAGVALFGYFWPAVRYPPKAVGVQALRDAPEVQFGDVARVLAVEVSPTQVQPGEPLWVKVTWQPLRRTARPYTVFVHMVDAVGAIVAQRDTWPGLGRAPTTSWRIDSTFVDTYRLDLSESSYAPNDATVRLGLYESEWGRLLLLVDDSAVSQDQSLEVGEVEIASRSGAWPNGQFASFAGEIALVGYNLEPRVLAGGEALTATLYWQVLEEPHYDYAIFAQVLDADFRVWGSHDGGNIEWHSGMIVTETRQITILPETPSGTYPIQVGLFHAETNRLPVVAPDGHYLDERVLLGPIRVQD